MNVLNQPTKGQVREWLTHRQAEHKPLPDMEQIRRELGWNLIESARREGCRQA